MSMLFQIAHGGAEFPTSLRGPAMSLLETVVPCLAIGKQCLARSGLVADVVEKPAGDDLQRFGRKSFFDARVFGGRA